jgi:hypothetical protein
VSPPVRTSFLLMLLRSLRQHLYKGEIVLSLIQYLGHEFNLSLRHLIVCVCARTLFKIKEYTMLKSLVFGSVLHATMNWLLSFFVLHWKIVWNWIWLQHERDCEKDRKRTAQNWITFFASELFPHQNEQ